MGEGTGDTLAVNLNAVNTGTLFGDADMGAGGILAQGGFGMDDFTVSSLHESKNEWCARLLTILTPCIISGFNSIFHESWKLCSENDEEDKWYLYIKPKDERKKTLGIFGGNTQKKVTMNNRFEAKDLANKIEETRIQCAAEE